MANHADDEVFDFGRVFDAGEVGIGEDFIVGLLIFVDEALRKISPWLFSEVVENGFSTGESYVKSPLQRLGRGAAVFHVVRDHHELGEIDEASEFRVLKAGVRAVALGENTVTVVRLLDLGR